MLAVITRKITTVKEAPSHQQLSVTFSIERISSDKPADVLQAGNAVNELNNHLEGMQLPSRALEASQNMIVSSSGGDQVIVSTVTSWEPLLRNLEQFVKAVTEITEVHDFPQALLYSHYILQFRFTRLRK